MAINKENLDKKICDCENTQTYREFILESEKAFELKHKDLDSLNDDALEDYLDFLDYLWEK